MKLWERVWEVRQWAFEPWLVPLGALLFFALFWIVIFLDAGVESKIRYAGLALQLFGLLTVAAGLKETRERLDKPVFKGDWLRRFPLAKRKPITASADLRVFVTVEASGYGMAKAGPNASFEERLAALEENIDRIHNRITKAEERLTEEDTKLHATIYDERIKREQIDEDIRNLLEDLSVGGLRLEIVGLVGLLLGLFLSTLPGEIVAFLGFTISFLRS